MGNRNIVKLLLGYGADINSRCRKDRTPLIIAAYDGDTKMIQFLIDNGANIDLVDREGWNALDITILRIKFQAAKLLSKTTLVRKNKAAYAGHTWRKYDMDMMFEGIDKGLKDIP